eukprot:888628_1
MSKPQGNNLKNLAATATAVVGGIALMTKLAKDELQHRNMKHKTDPNNVYSSIRILPDLVHFEGFIRIHKHTGNIICHVPREIKQPKQAELDEKDEKTTNNETEIESESQTKDSNINDKMESDDVENTQEENNNDNDIEIKWLKKVPNTEETEDKSQ